MFWLIENEKQFEGLYNHHYKEAFVEIIPFNNNIHPTQNEICAVYIRPLLATKGYMLPISHSETLTLSIDNIERILSQYNKVHTRDKKEFLHYFPLKTLYDITIESNTYIPTYTQAHSYFYSNYANKSDINTIIPIVKHYEYCETVWKDLRQMTAIKPNEFFNNEASIVFNMIERNGIKVNKELFEKNFHPINGDMVFTQFNFKTITRRPSNKFNGVNYAALSKQSGVREAFIPQNDLLVEVDISAYHPTLLAKLVNYDFEGEDIHKAFAKMYNVEYKKAKEITFQQLYGGIFDEYKELPFFKLVQEYTDKLWDQFVNDQYITCPISEWKIFMADTNDMNPPKLLNYVLQNLETTYNVKLLWKVLKLLRGCNTKIVLYTYDSVLLDFDMEDKEVLKELLAIFSDHGLKYSIVKGVNYQEMA
mgnify:CR=1 FL=1